MPDEQMSEPSIEQLSAYLDHELDPSQQQAVAEHVAGCAECQARLDGLRQAAYAIRALPMETSPRPFTVPEKRRPEPWRWAPVGWIGGVAVAMLIVVVGVTHLNFTPGGSASSSSNTSAQNPAALYAQPTHGAAGAGTESAAKAAAANQFRAQDAVNSARSILVTTDSQSYRSNGTMTVQIFYYGFVPSEVPPVQLLLERNGYAVQLPTPSASSGQAGGIQGQYVLSTLPLPNPVAGTYTLTAIQGLPGNSGATLVAHVTITISN